MDQNNNKKKPDQNKNSNWRGFIHLICWAVLLAALLLREELTARSLAGCALITAGTLLMVL